MARRAQRVPRAAAVAAAFLLLARPCPAAGPYGQETASLDLSHLTFVAGSIGSAAPAGPAREAAGAVEAREVDRARLERAIDEHLKLVDDEETRNGKFSKDLATELAALAALYQERGEHAAAIALLERAQYVVRVNEGLFSLDQVPLIEQALASHAALHDADVVADTQNRLLDLARRNPHDARVAGIYYEFANHCVEDVERYLTEGSKPTFGISMGFPGMSNALPDPRSDALSALELARLNYVQAIRAVAREGSLDGPTPHEIEAGLVRTYYIEALNQRRLFPPEPWGSTESRLIKPVFDYRVREAMHELGALSYERRIRYSERLERPDMEIASEQLELGDWHLLFGEGEQAFAAYRGARDILVRGGATADAIEAFFAPTTPTVLPTFVNGFISEQQAAAYKGYVGVSIVFDGVGKSTRVDVIERSVDATDEIVHRLKKHVAKSVFRPRFENGEWASEDRVSLRYYFTY